MSLIRCPECGKEISSKAESCPNCGCPQSAFNESNIPRELPPEEWPELFQCYRCGRNIPVGSSACPFCGYTYGTIRSVKENVRSFELSETHNGRNEKHKKILLPITIILIVIFVLWLFKTILLSENTERLNEVSQTNSASEVNNKITVKEETEELDNSEKIESVSIDQKTIYNDNDIVISTIAFEENTVSYDLKLLIENNSNLNLGFNAHAYSINGIMTGNSIYDMDYDVASGKKANTTLEIEKDFLDEYGIESIEYIDILFWAYDNDKAYKAFDTGQLTIYTNEFDDTDDNSIIGTTVYDNQGIKLDFIDGSEKEFIYCLINNTGNYLAFDVENVTINDYTSSDIDYDILNIITLDSCQSIFTIKVSDDFISENSISKIDKLEFSLSIRPMEDYFEEWNSEMISLEF